LAGKPLIGAITINNHVTKKLYPYFLISIYFFISFTSFSILIMRILSIYAPLLRVTQVTTGTLYIRPVILSTSRSYHSAEYSGGGLVGRDNFTSPITTPPTKGPEDPFAHLELAQLTDPRSVI
jgi:hypothetical protein